MKTRPSTVMFSVFLSFHVPGGWDDTKDVKPEGFHARGGGEAVHEPGRPSGGRIERGCTLEVGQRRVLRYG